MSKITRPILTGVFQRKRLFSLIDHLRKQPVVWVSGPPGCGKTTLVSTYLEARKTPCLWYQVDEGDADPATFFYYMGLAAKKASPKKPKPLPLLTPEYLQGIITFTQRYFEDLYRRLKVPSVLVLDNYHEVPSDSPFHEVMLHAISRIPEGLNMIFISRREPPPALIRLRANNLMNVLAWDELRLTPEESNAIVRLRTEQKMSRGAIQHLHNITDGWAAGLILMLESMKRGIEPQMLGKLTPDEIVAYFGKELFDKTDKEIQEFFLKTAFLPKMTIKMAETLTDLSHANRILSTLSKRNYFTEVHFHREPVYQYHPLFREFLLNRAEDTLSPEILSMLRHRAALLLEEDGQAVAAVSLLREVGDWDMLIRFILKYAPLMITQGRYRPLEEWLDYIPREVIENNPLLLYWMGACRVPFNPSFSRTYFEKAFEKFRIKEDAAGLFLAWSGIVESIWFDLSDFKLFDKWISVLEDLMHDFKEFPSDEIGARVASSMFIALVLRQPHHPDIEVWSERMLSSLERLTNMSSRITTLFRQAFYRMFTGEYENLIFAINSLRQLARSRGASPLALVTTKFAETIYYRIMGSHEKCLKAISDGLQLSKTTGIHVMDKMFLVHGVLSSLSVRDGKLAQELLDKMDSSLGRLKPWDTCYYFLLKTREALLREDFKQVSLHAEMAMKFGTDVGAPNSLALCHLMKAHVMHKLGNHDEAKEHLSHTFHIAEQIKAKNLVFLALSAEALFALNQDQEVSGLNSLRKALAIGREGKFLDTSIDLQSDMGKVCAKALEAGIEVEYVQELIRRQNLITEKLPLHLENWPWPLKIYTLGRFELLKDGKLIRFSRKAQQKPLFMLKALIAFGGKEVREDQIEDALWPEADGDAAHQSFKTNLHRLRNLIGFEKAIHLQEGRLTLDDRCCWVDAWAFEHSIEEAEVYWKEDRLDHAVQFTEKAIHMYKGPFLGKEIEQPWTISISERLRSKFLGSVIRLADHLQQAGQWEKALECYQRGIEVDDLAEEFYQGLMTCYHHLGQQTKALSIYNRCKKVLSATLGINPSPKTEAIYHSIKNNATVQNPNSK
jgi:LuxR family maltose regulon positive regulatory protein